MERDILALINKENHKFSKGQRMICRYISENYDKAAFMTAGKLGQTVGVLVDLHELHELVGLLGDLGLGQLLVLQAELHVLADGQMGENGVILEHHADVALCGVEIVDELVVEVEVAALDGIEAGDHPQQRGLAAAGRTEKREKLSFSNLQAEIRYHRINSELLEGMLNTNGDAHVVFLLFD